MAEWGPIPLWLVDGVPLYYLICCVYHHTRLMFDVAPAIIVTAMPGLGWFESMFAALLYEISMFVRMPICVRSKTKSVLL